MRMHRRLAEERGGALITVVMVTMVTSLLTTVFLTSVASSVSLSGKRKGSEQAIELARAGAEKGLAKIGANYSYSTTTSITGSATRAQVLSVAAGCTVATCLDGTGEGQMAWIVPAGAGVVFGIGYVPSMAAAAQTKVVRVEYSVVNLSSPQAFLAQGDVDVEGNAAVLGTGASVHSNATLTLGGSARIDGDATGSTAVVSCPPPPGVTVGGRCGTAASIALPSLDPSEYRAYTQWDLCPDGVVRATAGVACTGTVVGSGTIGWEGWKWVTPTWSKQSTGASGGFYVYQGNASISGSIGVWNATLVATGTGGPGAVVNGDIIVSGGGDVRPYSGAQITLMAQRDVRISGGGLVRGTVIAAEQVKLDGTGTSLNGQAIAGGTANSLGSAVSGNKIDGHFTLNAWFGTPAIQGGVSPRYWSEM